MEVEVRIFFPKAPLSCVSGEEKDAPRMQDCKAIAENKVAEKPNAPVEFLAYQIYMALKRELPMHVDIHVRVRKEGVSFHYLVPKEGQEKPRHPPRMWGDE